jgi:aminoglycoside 3-N-acetyltransferase I
MQRHNGEMRLRRLGAEDLDVVLGAAELFDDPPTAAATGRFLASPTHHIVMSFDDDGVPVGFVSGVETTHPDKGTEMFLYELSVLDRARRRGHGAALVTALREIARERDCYGMFVLTDADNEAALRTYGRAGAGQPTAHLMLDWEF